LPGGLGYEYEAGESRSGQSSMAGSGATIALSERIKTRKSWDCALLTRGMRVSDGLWMLMMVIGVVESHRLWEGCSGEKRGHLLPPPGRLKTVPNTD
jgi:hypothetical protein